MAPIITTVLLLLISVLSTGVLSASTPPTCPEHCVCTASNELLTVSCDGVSLAAIIKILEGQKLDELHLIHANDTKIDNFPFDGLRVLSITNSSLKTIGNNAWKRVEKSIEHITLSGNRMEIVPMFGAIKSLLSLNLNDNQISQVPEKAMSGMGALTQLRMESNRICEFPPKSLDSMKNSLVLLDLSDNCLSAIPAQILRNSASLTYLDLASNNISEINNFELMNLAGLRELRLQNNTLRRLHPMAFMNVPQLEYLYLQDNIISSLDGNRLEAFKKLEILDVRNNALYTLPSLKDLPNLKQVKVDGNLIEKIETLAFSNNPKLQLISMQNNNIAQISRNSFDSLDNLIVLLLANNSIAKIERGMLDGMRNLQQLSLRNNSLTALDTSSFPQLLHLTTLDLAYNQIAEIQEGSFDRLTKLFWLDLSNNELSGFKRNVFNKKISNILLDGNHLICDEDFDEFLTYLLKNRVRTFLPFQTEIKCAGPENMEGVRLKDMMVKKANDTINVAPSPMGQQQLQQQNILASLLPQLGGGFGSQSQVSNPLAANPISNSNSEAGSPNLDQMIASMPSTVINVPGFGNVDLSKMDPGIIKYVINGGQIPGIDRATLDGVIKQALNQQQQQPRQQQIVAPVTSAPSKFHTLPSIEKIGAVKSGAEVLQTMNNDDLKMPEFSPMMFSILKLLPTGYNLNRIPKEVIESLTRGEVPDLSLLPEDLLEHFKASPAAMTSVFDDVTKGKNVSIEEILSKLPVFARPELSTFVPYDINSLTSEMVLERQRDEHHKKIRIITAISLAFIGAITILVLAFFVNYTKKQRRCAKSAGGTPTNSLVYRTNPLSPAHHQHPANRPLPPAPPIYQHPNNF